MARLARIVIPGQPHHLTQRGNRRQTTFLRTEDYGAYLDLMAQWCSELDVEVWAYCLMPNHVHLIVVPSTEDALRRAIGEAHRRYTRLVNFREGWRGHLWQGRFSSCVLDEEYLLVAARYVELNPVRAGLASDPAQYAWSSAKAHLVGQDDRLVKVAPLLGLAPAWREFLAQGLDEAEAESLRGFARTGRPAGADDFVAGLEGITGRPILRRKPGPKRRCVS